MNRGDTSDRKLESIWEYPRPPKVEDTSRHILIRCSGIVVAESRHSKRVLETTHPPNYYLPPWEVNMSVLRPSDQKTFCEWKGWASYYTVEVNGRLIENACWCYQDPTVGYSELKDYISFYCGPMDECLVDGEPALPEQPTYYGGWITADIDTEKKP